MWCWITAVLSLCCRYSIHFTFIMQRSGPSGFLCGWLHLVIFSIPAHLLFARRSPPDLGLECFPSSLSDSSALGDCFPGSERHAARAGGSAYHTCCKIKGHSWRSGIMGEVKLYFLSFSFVFDHPIWPASTLHSHAMSHYSPYTQVLVFKKGSWGDGGLRFANVEKQQTDWMQPWAAGLERALKRLQGQWMWELLLSPGSDGNSDQIKDGSWVIRSLRSHLFITAGGENHIHYRPIMEGTVMMPDVCHQQVWMTCHHESYYTTDFSPVFTCVSLSSHYSQTVFILLLFWWWCSPLTFNYRQLHLICMLQSV